MTEISGGSNQVKDNIDIKEDREKVSQAVSSYLIESGEFSHISSSAINAFKEKMVDFFVPVEMRFRGKWARDRVEVFIWGDKVRDEYSRYDKLKSPGMEMSPEALHLKRIDEEMQQQFGISPADAKKVILRTVKNSLYCLHGNVLYKDLVGYRKKSKRSKYNVMSSGSRVTRAGGINANPPNSRSQWRKI